MSDLTDRYNEICAQIEGPTLLDEWEENPKPEVGRPSGQTIFEKAGDTAFLWDSSNHLSTIEFRGETMEVRE